MFDLPKDWFPHSVEYIASGRDSWGDDVEFPPVTVNHVRISADTSQNISMSGTENTSKAVIYVSPLYSSLTEFKRGQKIEYGNEQYTIQNIERFTQPTSDTTHHWKLELV